MRITQLRRLVTAARMREWWDVWWRDFTYVAPWLLAATWLLLLASAL
jgi:hypothetical protein